MHYLDQQPNIFISGLFSYPLWLVTVGGLLEAESLLRLFSLSGCHCPIGNRDTVKVKVIFSV